jgi:AcrR family transcriptional regulator
VDVKRKLSHRERQALATKQQVAEAARQLFAENGYVATTITAISETAEIPAQTIYSAFGNKRAILREIARLWIVAADTRRLHDESLAVEDPAERLRKAAHWQTKQFETGYDVITIYQQAARADVEMEAELRRVWAAREHELKGFLKTFDTLKLSQKKALDVFLACTAAEVYGLLVLDRNWSLEEYETWLGDTLVSQLL